MLRTMVVVCALALPGLAAAQDFPNSAVGVDVKADDGTVIGQVQQVTRDRRGRVVSAALPGEPADAPAASTDLVAEQPEFRVPVRYSVREAQGRQQREAGGAGNRALR